MSDADGSFCFLGLPASRYEIRVESAIESGASFLGECKDVVASTNPDAVIVRTKPAATLSVLVLDENRRPVAGANVVASDESGKTLFVALSNNGGRASVLSLPASVRSLWLTATAGELMAKRLFRLGVGAPDPEVAELVLR